MINSYNYKGFKVEMFFIKENNNLCATAKHLSSLSSSNADLVKKDIEAKIDNFLRSAPSTYKELALAIEDSLIWTGYDDCYIDADNLKVLVENFNKSQ